VIDESEHLEPQKGVMGRTKSSSKLVTFIRRSTGTCGVGAGANHKNSLNRGRSGVGPTERNQQGWVRFELTRVIICSSMLAASLSGLISSQAGADSPTSVTNLTASVLSPAAGATTDWTIGFTTSSTGVLVAGNSAITVTLPAGTIDQFANGRVTDTTLGSRITTFCAYTTGTTVTCLIDEGGPTVNAGDTLSVLLTGVTNPTATGAATSTVSTSSDTQPASTSVTLSPAQAISSLSLSTTSTAVGATANWTIDFTTSSTGVMADDSGSVTVTLPAGTFGSSSPRATIFDTTTGNTVANVCDSNGNGSTTLFCDLSFGKSVNAGDALSVMLSGVTNPTTAGSAITTVSTSSDAIPVTGVLTFTAAQAVSNLSLSLTSTAVGATTNWTIGFTTSSSGALPHQGGSTITVTLPTGTTFGSFGGGLVNDASNGAFVSNDCQLSGTTVVCVLGYSDVNAGDELSVSLGNVTNPTAIGSVATTVSTSSDTVQAVAPTVTLTAAQSVTGLFVSPTSTALGAISNWTIGFTTSSTGALASGNTVSVTLPTGATLTGDWSGTVSNTTTGQSGGSCTKTSTSTLTCPAIAANAGDELTVALSDVVNPATTGPVTTTVSTSSDTITASATFTVTAPQSVANLSVSPTSTAAAALANWTIAFATSSTGDLVGEDNVTLTLPSGISFESPSYDVGTITDTTTGQIGSDCANATGTTVTCSVTANSGDVLAVELSDIVNPTASGLAITTVSTSSDTATATTTFTVTASQYVANLSVLPKKTPAGATMKRTIDFTTSSTGALLVPGSTIMVTLPSGTKPAGFGLWSVTDVTTGRVLNSTCGYTSGTTVTCTLNNGDPINAGDEVSVVLHGVINPIFPGRATTSVSTSSDTQTATENVRITAKGPVCRKLSGTIAGTIKVSQCTPMSTNYRSASGAATAFTSGGGVLRWSTSRKLTDVTTGISSPGQGSCAVGSIERDVVGSITGGAASYTKAGNPVLLRMCQGGSGALSLVPGTKAYF
jgi:trimeric autotransporter adhesin